MSQQKTEDTRLQMLHAKCFLQVLGEKLGRNAKIPRTAAQGVIKQLDSGEKRKQFRFSAQMTAAIAELRKALKGKNDDKVNEAARTLRTRCKSVISRHDDEAHTRTERRQLIRAGASSAVLEELADWP